MTDAIRLRGLLVMLAVFVPVTVLATASTPGSRLFTAVTMSATFTVLVVVVMALWSVRPAWLAPGADAMKALGPEDRLQVTQAVRSGEALADPRLAEVASVVAVGTVRSVWLLLATSGSNLAVRAWLLAVDRDTAPPLLLDVLTAAVFFGLLAYGCRLLVRARRAAQVNREVGTLT